MAKNRIRHNAKARTSRTANTNGAAAKEGVKAAVPADTNMEMIDSQLSKAALIETINIKDHIKDAPEYMSKKKRKRLEAYIDKKLKKEERVKLMGKLAVSSFDSSLLISSAKLGQAKETRREQLRRALQEEKMGIHINSDPTVQLYQEIIYHEDDLVDLNSLSTTPQSSMISGSALMSTNKVAPTLSTNSQPENSVPTAMFDGIQSQPIVGSALKRKTDVVVDNETVHAHISDTTKTIQKNKAKRQKKDVIIPVSGEVHINSSSESEEEDDKVGLKLPKAVILPPKLKVPPPKDTAPMPNPEDQSFYILVERSSEVQEARLKLPVVQAEHEVMDKINNNSVVVICGETGSGKTTQVPQFLYEAGYGSPNSDNPGIIGVTQPRRVAAVAMAQRVAVELALPRSKVSHQIRYDTTTSPSTAIKFMTDGVLLKELATDFLLTRYSAIVIDEAHERNLNTDILIGVLSRVVRLRQQFSEGRGVPMSSSDISMKHRPLKLIIMSATLRVEDFTQNTRLFDTPPPVINVEARQYPITIHFNRRTPHIDHVAEAYKKTCKIHKRLPQGGILIFLTGQSEIQQLVRKLQAKFPGKKVPASSQRTSIFGKNASISAASQSSEIDKTATAEDKVNELDSHLENQAKVEVDEAGINIDDRNAEAEGYISESDDDDNNSEYGEDSEDDEPDIDAKPILVLPMYSLLPTSQQMKVFEAVPEGVRLCVVATNVAETSLTIPGIKYVVDCGKVKERCYDPTTSVQSYAITWTSKASADQRSGRAGRTGPGHCYRLYSSAVYDQQFSQFSPPEILKMPIEGVVLQLKSMNIDQVINFPFPTPPERGDLANAEKLLKGLGALDANMKCTEMGQRMAMFPVHPRFAKMLMLGVQRKLLSFVVCVVAALSVGDPFMREAAFDTDDIENDTNEDENENKEKGATKDDEAAKNKRQQLRKAWYAAQQRYAGRNPTSDVLKLLHVLGAFEYEGASEQFCEDNFLRHKAMLEMRNLRFQLSAILQAIYPSLSLAIDPKMQPPNASQQCILRQIIAAGFIDHLAIVHPSPPIQYEKHQCIYYQTMLTDEPVVIHHGSVLYALTPPPKCVVFTELFRTSTGGGSSFEHLLGDGAQSNLGGRVLMKSLTAIDLDWVVSVGQNLCTFGRPMETPTPRYNKNLDTITCFVEPIIGPFLWKLPLAELSYLDISPSRQTPIEAYRWFARALLEGAVVNHNLFETIQCQLLAKPDMLTKATFGNQRRIIDFVQALASQNVISKKRLLQIWRETPMFLLEQVLIWLPVEYHDKVKASWPPLEPNNKKNKTM